MDTNSAKRVKYDAHNASKINGVEEDIKKRRMERVRRNNKEDHQRKVLKPMGFQFNRSAVKYSCTRFFYKKLGSGHSPKSFLIQQGILSILVLKVS